MSGEKIYTDKKSASAQPRTYSAKPRSKDYEDVITKLDDIKGRIQKTVSVLSNKGWSGESQKNMKSL